MTYDNLEFRALSYVRRILRSGRVVAIATAVIGGTMLVGGSHPALAGALGTCDASKPVVEVSSPVPGPAAAIPAEAAAQVEQNPPGDIPDTQAFVAYTSAEGGYSISMPEGWARQDAGSHVTFFDKLHTFGVEIDCAMVAPTTTTATAETNAGGSLALNVPAFELVGITTVELPVGSAILIQYRANSAPDDVTGKQHRIDVDRYEVFKDGKLAILTLASPAGSDNVDVSRQVSESFVWLD